MLLTDLTCRTRVAGWTATSEGINTINTFTTMQTWCGVTVVNIFKNKNIGNYNFKVAGIIFQN